MKTEKVDKMKRKTKILIKRLIDKEIEEDEEWLKDEIINMRFNGIITAFVVLAWDIIHYEDFINMERAFHKHYNKKRLIKWCK